MRGAASAKCDAELDRRRVVCEGSDSDHVAYPTATSDKPLGVLSNGTDNAQEYAHYTMLGRGEETPVAMISGTGSKGNPVCPAVDGSGKIRTVPAVPGAYWLMGHLLEDAVDGQEVGFDDCRPVLVGAWEEDSGTFGVPAFDGDPTTPVESGFWYDLTADAFRVTNGTADATVQVVEDE